MNSVMQCIFATDLLVLENLDQAMKNDVNDGIERKRRLGQIAQSTCPCFHRLYHT